MGDQARMCRWMNLFCACVPRPFEAGLAGTGPSGPSGKEPGCLHQMPHMDLRKGKSSKGEGSGLGAVPFCPIWLATRGL